MKQCLIVLNGNVLTQLKIVSPRTKLMSFLGQPKGACRLISTRKLTRNHEYVTVTYMTTNKVCPVPLS